MQPLVAALLLITSAVLLGLSLWRFELSWLSLLGVLPLLVLAGRFLHWPRRRFVILTSLMLGSVYLSAFWWLIGNQASQWGVQAPTMLFSVVSVTFWLSLAVMALLGALPFVFLLAARRGARLLEPAALWLLPSAWAVGEYLRSWLFSLVYWGQDASIGPYPNLASLGFPAAVTPLAPLSRLVGLFGLSFVVILVGVAVYQLIVGRRRLAGAVLLVVGGLTAASLLFGPRPGTALNTAVLQTELREIGYIPAVLELARQQPDRWPVDVLVLPENSQFFSISGDESRQQLLDTVFGGGEGLIIATGTDIMAESDKANHTLYLDHSGKVIGDYQKQFLVVIGEYVPSVLEWGMRATGQQSTLRALQESRTVRRGTQPERPFVYRGVSYGTLACSGILAPPLYRQLAGQGAEVLVNGASQVDFVAEESFHEQTKQIARFNAVANAKPFIQASRGGRSYVIDGNGRFLLDTGRPGLFISSARIESSKTRTPYTLVGEWVVVASVLMLAGTFLARRRRGRVKT